MNDEVLQKAIASAGVCSRRAAEELIRKGKVLVNGKVAALGARVSENDVIEVQGKKIHTSQKPSKKIFALYKPIGYVTTLRAQKGQESIEKFLPKGGRYFPVGRLDKDSEGLLLLTNDGDLANKLTHPRYEVEKEYLVTLGETFSPEERKSVEQGVVIDGKKTAPCKIFRVTDREYRIILHEGRNRIIRKMLGHAGKNLMNLKRIRVGDIRLGNMQPGECKEVSK